MSGMGEIVAKPTFKLVVVSTLDGFIARVPGHAPHLWASPEEQEIFFSEVEAADWGIMGRGTHEAADKPNRRRIVFTGQVAAPDQRRATQIWVNPETLSASDLPSLVSGTHKFGTGLILGGTRVHDWFLSQGVIDEILLTIEPVYFADGLSIFSNQSSDGPEAVMEQAGFELKQEQILNANGTRLLTYGRATTDAF